MGALGWIWTNLGDIISVLCFFGIILYVRWRLDAWFYKHL